MSVNSYQKAKGIILANEEFADFIGGRSNQLIKEAEVRLGFIFKGLYLDFLKAFGAGSFGPQEVYGIIHHDFDNSSVPDAVWYTLTERKETNLPHHLFVIYDTGGGELYCLDVNSAEPRVVSFVPGLEIRSQKYEVIAEDFGDFLLELVEQEI